MLKKPQNLQQPKVLITGASGFIGHHLARFLQAKGYWVRGVDIRAPEFPVVMDQFWQLDLRDYKCAVKACAGVDWVFHLASDMGGMGFISKDHAKIFHGNSLIDLHTIEAARKAKVLRYFYASTACVYPEDLQKTTDAEPLSEDDLYPAQPQAGYGMEKFMGERLGEYYRDDYGLNVKIARFHNVFGPEGTYDGGREKAPAALCRKVAEAKLGKSKTVEIWGDGEQTRSFLYINDALEGILKFMQSEYSEPLNIGSDRTVSINEMVEMIVAAAGTMVHKIYVDGPQGVRGRCSSNVRAKEVLGWEPTVSLEEGLARTYRWVEKEVSRSQP